MSSSSDRGLERCRQQLRSSGSTGGRSRHYARRRRPPPPPPSDATDGKKGAAPSAAGLEAHARLLRRKLPSCKVRHHRAQDGRNEGVPLQTELSGQTGAAPSAAACVFSQPLSFPRALRPHFRLRRTRSGDLSESSKQPFRHTRTTGAPRLRMAPGRRVRAASDPDVARAAEWRDAAARAQRRAALREIQSAPPVTPIELIAPELSDRHFVPLICRFASIQQPRTHPGGNHLLRVASLCPLCVPSALGCRPEWPRTGEGACRRPRAGCASARSGPHAPGPLVPSLNMQSARPLTDPAAPALARQRR